MSSISAQKYPLVQLTPFLQPHAESLVQETLHQVGVVVARQPSDEYLILDYEILQPEHIQIPERSKACSRRDGLWQRTCFELFARKQFGSAYIEFNFSPSGDWAFYQFSSYRKRLEGSEHDIQPFSITTSKSRLTAKIPWSLLLGIPSSGDLYLGYATVLEDRKGALSYWAIKHPHSQPDFHDAQNMCILI